ncbi:MAG TPA: TetR/AcrR family transcriptional regulator [Smithellaceae bacterium]|nr:TetR/AcrR family transcriptional regulator [Smithellaceae bacterium]HRS88514.1 TetR/AcrR family transcriptional regulator [Smithellaceae bacterium]HRV25268.1 TetR/AcrR family transcriptional regulator [Smithellaceae bacterium]
MSPQEKRKKEKESKRNNILKAARKLFFDKGFKAVTVDSIAAKAGVSKGSIYLYFDSKEEIYAQVLIADNIEHHKDLVYFSTKDAPATELLLEYSEHYVNNFLHDNELFRILMTFMLQTEQMNLTPQQNAELIRTTNENIKFVSVILQRGIDTGEFLPTIDIRQTQNAIWGLLNGIISLFLFLGNPNRRAEKIHSLVKESLNIFIKGLRK